MKELQDQLEAESYFSVRANGSASLFYGKAVLYFIVPYCFELIMHCKYWFDKFWNEQTSRPGKRAKCCWDSVFIWMQIWLRLFPVWSVIYVPSIDFLSHVARFCFSFFVIDSLQNSSQRIEGRGGWKSEANVGIEYWSQSAQWRSVGEDLFLISDF